jgi:hypothetical protein
MKGTEGTKGMKGPIRNIYRNALLLLLPMAAISAFWEPRKLPMSVLVGGVLALVNLRGLTRGLENFLGTDKAYVKLMLTGTLRLLLLSAVLVILAASRTVNLLGLLLGFTVVITLVVIDGYRTARAEGTAAEPDP